MMNMTNVFFKCGPSSSEMSTLKEAEIYAYQPQWVSHRDCTSVSVQPDDDPVTPGFLCLVFHFFT